MLSKRIATQRSLKTFRHLFVLCGVFASRMGYIDIYIAQYGAMWRKNDRKEDKPRRHITVYEVRNMRSNEKRDAFVNACVTKQQKAALADFCWQNRITKSELVMNLIDDFLSEIRVKT